MKGLSLDQGQKLSGLLKTYFFTRTDKVAALMPWEKPHPIEGGDNLDALLLAHIMGEDSPKAVARYQNRKGALKVESGHYRVGSYTPDEDGQTRWLCLDFDGGADHADALADPQGAVIKAYKACSALGISSLIECSGGGKGWHLWVLFSESVSAKDARLLGLAIAPKDAPLVAGGCADARRACGIEIFPKQDKIKKKSGFGNLVWLPLWSGSPDGANEFYRPDGEKFVPFVPESFDTITPERLAAALSLLPGQPDRKPVMENPLTPATVTVSLSDDQAIQTFLNTVEQADSETSPAPSSWKLWREKALSTFPLESVYGPWLTGAKSGEHWFECRDPNSPSGDQNPSAGVAVGSGDAPRGTFHSFRTGENTSVFDFMVKRGMAAAFGEALKKVAELSGVPLPTDKKSAQPSSPVSGGSSYPVIVVNDRQLRSILWDTRQVLHAANAQRPFLFRRSGRVARVTEIDGRPQIEFLDDIVMYGVLARIADWVRRTTDGDADVMPPHDVARDLVNNVDPEHPVLDAVITAPVFDAKGNLVATPGYHQDSGLWYHAIPGFNLPPVPEAPSDEEIAAARSILVDDLLVDFPFVAQSDRAHAVAAIILPFVRRMIEGATPIHLVEAPTPGSGKSLIADAVHRIATGSKVEVTTLGRDEEETRKKITSVLSAGKPIILIDNVKSGLESADLAAAITSETWQDRLLGQTKIIWLPNRAVWMVTGNNLNLSLEIARRCVRIRLKPKEERPWLRTKFKHKPLEGWIDRERVRLVHAVLVLVRAWIEKGSPLGGHSLGSFDSWAQVMGGILETVGISGFLSDTSELYDQADTESQEWRAFVSLWWAEFQDWPKTVRDLIQLALDHELLLSVIGTKGETSQAVRLGKALSANRERNYAGYRIESTHGRTNQNLWRLRLVEGGPSDQPTQLSLDSESKMQEVETSEPSSPAHLLHNLLHDNPMNTFSNPDMQEVAGGCLYPLRAREENSDTYMHAHTRTHIGGEAQTSCNPLHLLQSKENQGVRPQEVGLRRLINGDFNLLHSSESIDASNSNIDLADFADEGVEE